MPIYTTPLEFNCIGIVSESATFCLPPVVNCDPIDPDNPDEWLNEPGNEWNNNLCQTDRCYFVPFADGDKVQFQTRFVDPGRDTPTPYDTLILVELLDQGDNVLSTINPDALRKMTAWDGKHSYQIIEFDLSLLGEDCFKIQFTSQDKVIVTNSYRKINNCKNTLTMRSDYGSMDCFGYRYNEPEEYDGDLITYDNTMRYYATIKLEGNTIQKNRIGNKATTGALTTNWKIILREMIPPFVKSIMVDQHLMGERVYIDGQEYLFDDIVVEPDDTKNNMFFFTVRPQKVCNVNYRCK